MTQVARDVRATTCSPLYLPTGVRQGVLTREGVNQCLNDRLLGLETQRPTALTESKIMVSKVHQENQDENSQTTKGGETLTVTVNV